jgi:hypothetical protein
MGEGFHVSVRFDARVARQRSHRIESQCRASLRSKKPTEEVVPDVSVPQGAVSIERDGAAKGFFASEGNAADDVFRRFGLHGARV